MRAFWTSNTDETIDSARGTASLLGTWVSWARPALHLVAVGAVLAMSSSTFAQWRLPTSPSTVPITLNDTTIAGSAIASDEDDTSPIAAQPAPLDRPADGVEVLPHGMPNTESPPIPGVPIEGGFIEGQPIEGNYTEGSCSDGACGGCGEGSCGEGDDACRLICQPQDPWRLFGCCNCLCRSRVSVRGWLSGGYTANFDDPASRFNGPVTFNDRDETQFNQGYLVLERAVDTECYGWDIGGRVDLLYGSDYRFTIARGLDAEDDFTSNWHTNRFYGLAMPQAYLETAVDKVSLKLGHFYTIIGYEVVTAPDNFFYSRAYTMQYGEPFTHTGALATWTPNEQLSVIGGATFGWDNFENVYDDVSFLGGVTFAASDGNSKLALAMHVGDEEQAFGTVTPNDERVIYSVVYNRSITDRLNWIVQHDHGWQDNVGSQGDSAEWYGLNQYLIYKIDCCWSLGARVEWFRDDDGFRVAPAGDYPALGVSNNPASAGGFEGNFWAVTMGLNYKPTGNLILRPEVRYDTYEGSPNAAGNEPFDDGNEDHQWLAAFDVIFLY
jgi:hypothetical protein